MRDFRKFIKGGCSFDSTLTTFNQARSSVNFCKNKGTSLLVNLTSNVNPITNAFNRAVDFVGRALAPAYNFAA